MMSRTASSCLAKYRLYLNKTGNSIFAENIIKYYIIFSYLNINSIRNKFGDLDTIVDGNIDILCIAETKLDESFPNNQFVLVGYHLPYRLDITD